MDSPQDFVLFWLMVAILLTLVAVSNVRFLGKVVLFMTSIAMAVFFLHRSLLGLTPIGVLTLLVLLFLPGGHSAAVYLWLFCLGGVASVYTLSRAVPPQVVLGFVVAGMISGYVAVLTVLAYNSLDPAAFTAFLGLLYLGWYGVVHDDLRLRPA